MKLLEETYNIQEKLGRYCKTGEETSIPGLTGNRITHYRRLVSGVVRNTMFQAFPVSLKVLGEAEFESIVDHFFAEYDCRTPQVWKLPGEFYEWYGKRGEKYQLKWPWLGDLLLLEWIEIDVHTMADHVLPEFRSIKNIFTDVLVLNPEFKIIHLQYPVHLYKTDEAINRKGEYFVMISRHPDTGKVYFFNLSYLYTWLIDELSDTKRSLAELTKEINNNFGIESEIVLRRNLEIFMSELVSKKIILGRALEKN